MRAVDFDPDAWLADAERADAAIPAKAAIFELPIPVGKVAKIAGIAEHAFPQFVLDGLVRLRMMEPPRITKPEVWPRIVASALQIATDGWASQALALGWDGRSLWGVEPSADPDPRDYSLAVLLAGRSIRAVDEHRFYMRDGDVRSFFERRERPSLTKYLWEI